MEEKKPDLVSKRNKCVFCGKMFKVKHSKQKFCNHKCYSRNLTLVNSGLDHPRYIASRYKANEETGCWEWLLCLTAGNWKYGQMTVGGKRVRAHRYYYEKYRGKIPKGLFLDHLCGNTICVNPEHLEPVSNRENLIRGKGTRLTNGEVIEIRSSKLKNKELSKIYGVGMAHLSRIRKGTARKFD